MIRFYGIEIDPDEAFEAPRRREWRYLCTGYGECFDSFFAFGLFNMAKESGFFPPELVVGTIDSSELRQDGVYYEYDVRPTVNFSVLEEVLIIAGDEEAEAEPALMSTTRGRSGANWPGLAW